MENKSNNWLQRPIHPALPAITNEIALFAGIILLAIITRFYDLGTRVMSHDESLHTYFSWLLYRGQGYQHTPMMHGPFQFHALALSYFLFGVSDFTARIPSVLFSIATVWMVWPWRRYLGKWGAIIAAFLMVISPYMLYYGRYVRNESFAGFAGIVLLYGILRYLDSGENKYLYFITAATVLHFTSKETAFIYTAQALIFLGILFIVRITANKWPDDKFNYYNIFVILLAGVVLLAGVGAGFGYVNHQSGTLSSTETAAPADPTTGVALPDAPTEVSVSTILFAAAFILLLGAVVILIIGYGWAGLLKERSFDIILLLMTFVLPMLVPFILNWLKSSLNVIIPTDAASVSALDTRAMTIIGVFVTLFFAVSIIVGLLWKRDWWKYAALFWGTFILFYTTIFTNAPGFFTGLLGSLGYWLEQQAVERGSQPEYYYWLIQIPIYEFMTAIGSLTAIGLGLKKLFGRNPDVSEAQSAPEDGDEVSVPVESDQTGESSFGTLFGLLVFWVVTSILAFTVAGERMPWLTYHMAWPMVILTGWGIGQIIESVAEKLDGENRVWQTAVTLFVAAVFGLATLNVIRSLFGATPPFQGTELMQLQATSAFLLPLVTMILTAVLLAYLMKDDFLSLGIVALFAIGLIALMATIINGASLMKLTSDPIAAANGAVSESFRFAATLLALIGCIAAIIFLSRMPRKTSFVSLAVLTAFGLLAVQTGRTAFRASYIFYDDATEYLVYAHGATGIKEVMTQMDEISERTAGGLNAVVAYDASAPDTGVSWPFVWYLRDYTALRSFDAPTRSLREAVAVVVDQKNFDKINAALGNEFYEFDYIRMWWPNQDYFNLNQSRVLNAITDRNMREGIFDIWFDRDYTKYAQATGSTGLTLTDWNPADQMKFFIRKDVASQIWNYGVGPSESTITKDPYEDGITMLAADQVFGSDRYLPLGLNAPRAIAPGLNDDLYIADSRNHRILHIASDGSLLNAWGTFADTFSGDAPIGTLNEPWGVAVGPDGSVYVTDTWNHRVQKFTGDGTPITMWGQFGQPVAGDANSAGSFWGPRGIAVDANGHVLVTDTGNKRIVVFDEDGNYITEFGEAGFDPGQFDEPVGLAIAPNSGTVYVVDTWNQRVQAFSPSEDGTFYFPTIQWDVNGWFGQSLDNKPFIAVGPNEHVFVTDPEGYRVIEFTADGQFVRTWGDFGNGLEEIGLAAGVTVDQLGFVWVTDAGNNRILKYRLP